MALNLETETTSGNAHKWTMEVYEGETKVSSFTGTRTLRQILIGVREYLLKQTNEQKTSRTNRRWL